MVGSKHSVCLYSAISFEGVVVSTAEISTSPTNSVSTGNNSASCGAGALSGVLPLIIISLAVKPNATFDAHQLTNAILSAGAFLPPLVSIGIPNANRATFNNADCFISSLLGLIKPKRTSSYLIGAVPS